MRRWLSGRFGARLRFLPALLGLFVAACHVAPPRHPMANTNPQAELARSLGIIRTSTPANPKTLKILFYGQSITSPKWTDIATAYLQATYTNTHFIVRNMAIGGFRSQYLERTVERDVAEFYPDLIVFHVYGDHRAYERIIRTIRSKTAAEVIVQTDHVTQPIEPLCDTGFHLTLHAPPGCRGFLLYKQNEWEEFMSGVWVPGLAARYGLAVDPRRWAWNAYLRRNGMPLGQLLADGLHPNATGWSLMAKLFDVWFDHLVRDGRPHPQSLVEDHAAPVSDAITFEVSGNRIELLASERIDDKVAVRIDGKAPQDIDGCWQTSRTARLPVEVGWPAIRQVTVEPTLHRAERWTAVITDLSPKQDQFRFRLYSSIDGFDGEGKAKSDFTSASGHVRIAAQDWAVTDLVPLLDKRIPEGFRVRWDRHFACGDEPAVALGGQREEVRHILATGLPNGTHRIELRLAPGTRGLIDAIRIYRPPLVD